SSETLTLTEQENTAVVSTRSGRVLQEPEKKVEGEKNEEAEVERDEGVVEERAREPTRTRVVNTHIPKIRKIPFPKALVKKNLDKQFSKFLEVFKKLHINIPFSEALEQMPIYAKFMKDILSKRRKLSEVDETILMTEECSAILQRKMPKKRRDPGSFTIPVEIEGLTVVEALCDQGASINLMPLSMFKR
ncbi:hypothetical protein, partial [Bradyrhizobium sp. TM233]|uniref:hypothetical protein n=1 Tax=Bradyrhizobium sp. TM233 TaxID=2599801 RepID=UPI0030C677E2